MPITVRVNRAARRVLDVHDVQPSAERAAYALYRFAKNGLKERGYGGVFVGFGEHESNSWGCFS